ncbi:MAG: ElyC/SanA/YdcF family protein [Propionibacteriaceae bacterium]|nr:ElyC/SanA/YdcF family protein [Propionibacteriaceae bacterium]
MTAGGELVAPARGPRLALRVMGYLALAGFLSMAAVVGVVALGARHVQQVSAGRTFTVDDVPARPIAMVLGAKADAGRPSAFLAARLDLAVELYEMGKIKAVLVSGDNLAGSNFETRVMRDYLVNNGVPADRVVEDPAGYDTYDSCVRARDVFGVTEMLILTQLYHLERAITICTDIGVDAVGVGDVTARRNFPELYAKGEAREWAANLKMEWDLVSRRVPQQDPFDDSLLRAAGL